MVTGDRLPLPIIMNCLPFLASLKDLPVAKETAI